MKLHCMMNTGITENPLKPVYFRGFRISSVYHYSRIKINMFFRKTMVSRNKGYVCPILFFMELDFEIAIIDVQKSY